MGFRDSLATSLLSYARMIGHRLGCHLVVEVEGSKLKTKMEVPNTNKRGWDSSFYEKAGLFIKGFANPVKPVANRNPNPKEPDELEMDVGGDVDTDDHFDIIPSYRYTEHQDQHVLSELVNPTEQWRLIVFLLLGIGALVFVTIIVVLYTSGSF